ncbi:glycosyltransferase family 2 protein [Falsiroseomonas oryzae]|uniref:glycosyltransferase family 2 protein n=1 Tax=Falsiroseomonas oryzae TaxID=2766473 RepID=UPI0022EAF6A6|nr:glycosyltransferase family 2 protein [Roseomonas sp. MO-31]
MPLRTRLRIHLYSICWNEAAMLGFFFRHYDPWVSRYVFYDDGSTDGTLDILAAHPRVEIRRFQRSVPDSFVLSMQELQNDVWRESRGAADWVVITAVDEHLHHPRLVPFIEACHAAGVTAIPALGYQMVADAFPPPDTDLCRSLTLGAPHAPMSKLSLFRPDRLARTNFGRGRHRARPTGRVTFPERDELMLLHYKYLGEGYTAARHALLATGLGARDQASGWGGHYTAESRRLAREFAGFRAAAVDIADPGHEPWRDHREPRWWRADPDRQDDG